MGKQLVQMISKGAFGGTYKGIPNFVRVQKVEIENSPDLVIISKVLSLLVCLMMRISQQANYIRSRRGSILYHQVVTIEFNSTFFNVMPRLTL